MPATNVGDIMYFPLRARAEPHKLMCHYAKLGFTDKVVPFDDWAVVKPTTPLGQLPVLIKAGGEMLPESADIARYIASLAPKELELIPEDETKAKEAARLFDAANTYPVGIVNPLSNWFTAEEAAEKVDAKLPEVMQTLNGLTKDLPEDKPFFGGEKPHYGDFGLFHYVDLLRTISDPAWQSLGPKWVTWYNAMASLPGVKEYIASRPQAGNGTVGRPGSRLFTMPLDDFRTNQPGDGEDLGGSCV